jgi:hypothetical protein
MTLSKGPTTSRYANSGKMAQVANFPGRIYLKDARLSEFWTLYLKGTSYRSCGAKRISGNGPVLDEKYLLVRVVGLSGVVGGRIVLYDIIARSATSARRKFWGFGNLQFGPLM